MAFLLLGRTSGVGIQASDNLCFRIDVAEQRPGIPHRAVVSVPSNLVSKEQGYRFFQPDLPPFFLRPEALKFSFLRVPGIPEFLRPFLCLFPRTSLGADSAMLAWAVAL